MTTNVNEFIADLDGGQLEQRLSHILSNVAGAVTDHHSKGEINLKLTLKPIGNGAQIGVTHNLKYTRPTSLGSQSEDYQAITAMHVGTGGKMSFFPENQTQMFSKKGEPQTS